MRKTILTLTVLCAGGAVQSHAAEDAAWYQPPFRIEVGGVPLDIANPDLGGYYPDDRASDAGGHAAPFLVDLDGDGKRDLIVGSFSGLFRWYRNIGTDTRPRFPREFVWLQAGQERAHVPITCCVSSGPQLVDITGDGIVDLTAGSYAPGLIYWFKGIGNGKFEPRQILTFQDGMPVFSPSGGPGSKDAGTPSYMTNVAWADWDNDGKLDMIVGDLNGRIVVYLNKGTSNAGYTPIPDQPLFDNQAIEILIAGERATPEAHVAPGVADWDGDGRWDILFGTHTGAVYWLRNTGEPGKPEFKTREQLLPHGAGQEQWVESGQLPRRSQRSQIHAVDYNGDGKLDLVVGEWAYTQTPRKELTRAERHALQILRNKLEAVDKQAGYDAMEYRGFSMAYLQNDELKKQAQALRQQMAPYLESYGEGQFKTTLKSHGQVWVFLRK